MLHRQSKLFVFLSLLSILSSSSALPTAAQIPNQPPINDNAVTDMLAAFGGVSSKERTRIMHRNLSNALMALSGKPAQVEITNLGGFPIITLSGYYITSIDESTAAAMGTDVDEAARIWASSLEKALMNGNRRTLVHAAVIPRELEKRRPVAALKNNLVRIPAGLQLPVKLSQKISSDSAMPGTTIESRLSRDITLDSGAVLSQGTKVIGTIEPSLRSGTTSGALAVWFDELQLKDGTTIPISTAVVGGLTDDQRAALLPVADMTYPRLLFDSKSHIELGLGQRLILELRAPAQVAVSGTVL